MSTLRRRTFMKGAAASAVTLSAATYTAASQKPNEKIRIAQMGLRIRGRQHLNTFSRLENAEIVTIIDPDENLVPEALRVLAQRQQRVPQTEKDVRRVLEDRNVDALAIAAPDHWHALATVWACQAGKHVYCEKPVSHNLNEGKKMVQAARRYNKVVQVGTQRRSGEQFREALELVRSGRLGKIPFARTWIAGNRATIGRRQDTDVPRGVDYDLWLGPAPQRPFNPNRFHYNWHWNWDTGTGEIGNNGIHGLDLVRWLLNLEAPTRVCSGGGLYFYEDDMVTPDTHIAVFDFPNCSVMWEHRIWSRTGLEGQGWGIALYGQNGTLITTNSGWTVQNGIEATSRERDTELPHFRNFLNCIRSGERPNADIEDGHKSTRLCHLGNIALRLGRTLNFDAATETCRGDDEANRMLGRTYRQPFVMPDTV
jgi:predicted dehydrogenase